MIGQKLISQNLVSAFCEESNPWSRCAGQSYRSAAYPLLDTNRLHYYCTCWHAPLVPFSLTAILAEGCGGSVFTRWRQ